MEQTELQKQFERETGCSALCGEYDERLQELVWYATKKYSDWLEAKAAAYDRLMSRDGVKKRKEIANILGRNIAMDADGQWNWFAFKPVYVVDRWVSVNGLACGMIPFKCEGNIKPEDSLTLPDGWEEK